MLTATTSSEGATATRAREASEQACCCRVFRVVSNTQLCQLVLSSVCLTLFAASVGCVVRASVSRKSRAREGASRRCLACLPLGLAWLGLLLRLSPRLTTPDQRTQIQQSDCNLLDNAHKVRGRTHGRRAHERAIDLSHSTTALRSRSLNSPLRLSLARPVAVAVTCLSFSSHSLQDRFAALTVQRSPTRGLSSLSRATPQPPPR